MARALSVSCPVPRPFGMFEPSDRVIALLASPGLPTQGVIRILESGRLHRYWRDEQT